MQTWVFVMSEISVIGCALVAGVFLTFSDFVMRSLKGAKTSAGVEVMQLINREVYTTIFLVLLLGMSALTPALGVYAFAYLDDATGGLMLAGGILYFAGVFIVSVVRNVPMNKRLDTLVSTDTTTAAYWTNTYLPRWTFWNSVRAVSAGAAAVCFLVALTITA